MPVFAVVKLILELFKLQYMFETPDSKKLGSETNVSIFSNCKGLDYVEKKYYSPPILFPYSYPLQQGYFAER